MMPFALDTDVLTLILLGHPSIVPKLGADPSREYVVPAIVVEELLRGRLAVIRDAEAGRAKVRIDRAYELLVDTIDSLHSFKILQYPPQAETQFQEWKSQKVRASTHDLRIAATCVVGGATLVSRNRRDFERVPRLNVEYW